MSDKTPKINPFPAQRIGLWRVRAVPYLLKEGDLKRRMFATKLTAPSPVASGGTAP